MGNITTGYSFTYNGPTKSTAPTDPRQVRLMENFGSLSPKVDLLQQMDLSQLDSEGLIDQMKILKLFLSKQNCIKVSKQAFQYARSHGYNPIVKVFTENVPILMNKWVTERVAQRFSVKCGDTFDWFQTIEFMNEVFLRDNREYIIGHPEADAALGIENRVKASDIGLTDKELTLRNKILSGLQIEVGTINEYENTREFRDYSRLMVDDYKNLDVWAPKNIYAWDRCPQKELSNVLGSSGASQTNKNTCYPCNNPTWASGLKPLFPIQQDAGAIRRYDRSNDGLQDTKEHSERGTHLRPFDMSEIYKLYK